MSCTSDSTCTAKSPADSPGTVAVTVTTTAGTSSTGTSDQFTYVSPTVLALEGSGQSAISGTRFRDPLIATVELSDSPGAQTPVTFTVATGSASFGGHASATTGTDANGVATAPTLTAGKTAGAVTVTVTTPGGSSPATYRLTVLPVAANLDIKLSGPPTVSDGLTFHVVVVVTNHGPSTAKGVVTTLVLPTSGVAVTEEDGAARSGFILTWTASTLASGRAATYIIDLRVLPESNSRVTITAATHAHVHDPDPANNTARMALRLG